MTAQSGSGLGSSMWAARSAQSYRSYQTPRSRSVPPVGSPDSKSNGYGSGYAGGATTASAAASQSPGETAGTSRALPAHTTATTSTMNNPTSTPTTRLRNAPTGDLDPIQALHRFEQTCRRLNWRIIDLLNSLQRTSDHEQWGFSAAEAEMNFKVDFHETYIWIEQALVFLQLVFGIIIPRSAGAGAHAYHHNVLQALVDASNPLYEILGKGDAKEALWKAKELRNRWKDAAVDGTGTPPVKMYAVEWILRTVMEGLERAWPVARGTVEEVRRVRVEGQNKEGGSEVEGEEEGWNWMMEDGDTEMVDV